MRILSFFKTYLKPQKMLRYKSMSVIISICIFVISSFLIGIPVGQNKVAVENDILENYNFNVLSEIPDLPDVNQVIKSLFNKECKVSDGKELICENLEPIDLYINKIEFEVEGITKRVHFVIDMFDIPTVYIDDVEINFPPLDNFTILEYPYETNVENYLVIFASDSLYFQAHPYGTDALKINHGGQRLKTEVVKIFYQNNIPDFELNIENPEVIGYYLLGQYLIEQLIIGNANTIKLKAFILAFLVGVCFTLITVLILWVFFRKSGKIKNLSEYYNIAAITSLPISITFFILLWFIPSLIYFYIFVFSSIYIIMIYIINTAEDLV